MASFNDLLSVTVVQRKDRENKDTGEVYKGDVLRVSISEGEATERFPAQRFVGIRFWYTGKDGTTLLPTNKGLSVRPDELPELIKALQLILVEVASPNPGTKSEPTSDDNIPF